MNRLICVAALRTGTQEAGYVRGAFGWRVPGMEWIRRCETRAILSLSLRRSSELRSHPTGSHPMQELTPRQSSILKFIELFIAKNQQPPAEREIAAHFRIHQSAIRKHLDALEKKG